MHYALYSAVLTQHSVYYITHWQYCSVQVIMQCKLLTKIHAANCDLVKNVWVGIFKKNKEKIKIGKRNLISFS